MIQFSPIQVGASVLCTDALNVSSFGRDVVILQDPPSVEELGIRPLTSPKHIYGDRICYHDNFNGVVTCVGSSAILSRDVIYEDTKKMYFPYFTAKLQNSTITWKILSVSYWGQLSLNSTFTATDNTTYHRHIAWRGNELHIYFSYVTVGSKQYTTLRRHIVYTRTLSLTLGGSRVYYASAQTYTYTDVKGKFPDQLREELYPTPNLPGARQSLILIPSNWAPSTEVFPWSRTALQAIAGMQQMRFPDDPDDIWGSLCQTAAQDAQKLDVNTGLYAYQIMQIKSCIAPFVDLFKKKPSIRSCSKAYLAYHYGLRLNWSDTKEVWSALSNIREMVNDKGHSWVRSAFADQAIDSRTKTSYSRSYHYKINYDPRENLLTSLLYDSFEWDLFPTLSNVWDVIPFSFVLDWFIGIQDALEQIDTRTLVSVLNVDDVLRSSKITTSNLIGDFVTNFSSEAVGAVYYTRYHRTIQGHCDLPNPAITKQSFHNFVELTTLLIANSRRR